MNIGTNTGAMTAHLADALPMKRLMSEDSTTNASMRGTPPSPEARSVSAPLTAMMRPRFVQLKYATNCAAKNTSTRYVPSVPIVLPMPFITSVSLRNVPAPAPYATPTAVPPAKRNATIPVRNGERSRLPVSGLRRKPSAGMVPHSRRAPNATAAAAAKRRPRHSAALSCSSPVSCSPAS